MKTILFFGDSNTWGYDPRGIWDDRYPEEVRWVDRLRQRPEASCADGHDWNICSEEPGAEVPGWDIHSDGMNGRRIPVTEAENEYAAAVFNALPPGSIFAPMLGTNDLLEHTIPSPERVEKRMENWIRRLQPLRPDVAWILITPPSMGSENSQDLTLARFHLAAKKLAGRYQKLADRYGMYFIDTTAWQIPLAYDGVHFSEDGHLRFAEYMAEQLGEICMIERRKQQL